MSVRGPGTRKRAPLALLLALAASASSAACRTSLRGSAGSPPALAAPSSARVGPEIQRVSWHPSAPPAWGDVGPAPSRDASPAPVAALARLRPAPQPPVPPPPASWTPPPATVCPPPCPAPCDPTFSIEPRARYWRPWASGSIYITIGGQPGTASTIELDDDLGVDPADLLHWGLDVGLRRHRVRLAYEPIGFTGRSTLDRSVIYHGATYPAGETVESDVRLNLYRAAWDYRILGDPTTGLRAGAGAEAWTFDARLEGETTGLDHRRSFTHVMPLATVEGETHSGAWRFAASAAVGFLETDRYTIDVEASAGLRVLGRVELDVGWRLVKFAFRETTNIADMTFHGPFLQASVVF